MFCTASCSGGTGDASGPSTGQSLVCDGAAVVVLADVVTSDTTLRIGTSGTAGGGPDGDPLLSNGGVAAPDSPAEAGGESGTASSAGGATSVPAPSCAVTFAGGWSTGEP